MSGEEWVDWTHPLPEEEGPSPVQERAAAASERESLGPAWGVEEWHLPGHGERGPRCGEVVVSGVCLEGHPQFSEERCTRRGCPNCWGLWAQEAAMRAAVRVQAYRLTQPADYRRQAAHAVVSPPEETIKTAAEYWDGYSEAAALAEAKGFRGFAVVGHPWRPTQAAKDQYRAADPDLGIWVWIRRQEDQERLYRWSPHYHVIGPTSPDMDPAKVGDKWNYTFIRSLNAFEGLGDEDSHEDVFGLFRYLLSHTGWPEESSKQVTRWYGDLANSVFVEDPSQEWQVPKPDAEDLEQLEHELASVAGVAVDERDERAADPKSEERCKCEECRAQVVDVFDLEAYLRQQEPPEDVRAVMQAAHDWRLSRVEPPPGLKRPQTEEQAAEALDAIVEGA